jgi:IS5 family transposase
MAYQSCTSTPDLFDSYLASPPKNEVLRELGSLIDWAALRQVVAPAYNDLGRIGYDPVALIKLLILQRLYALSDPAVVAEAADRLSFREFLDLRASDPIPDDTTLVKFRGRLRIHGLTDKLMEALSGQLQARGIRIQEGSIKIVDATLVRAAVHPPRRPRSDEPAPEPLDPDADFTVRDDKPFYGFKLHVAQDRSTGLIAGHVVTPASTHDSQVFEEFLDQGEREVLADKAYDSRVHREICSALRIKASIMKKPTAKAELSAWWKRRNRAIGRVRGFVEGTFAHLKRYLGCGRAVYRGLQRVHEQLSWGVMVFNLRRAVALRRG